MLSDLILRLRALVRRTAVEREVAEELRFHLDRQAEAYQRAGLDPDEAARRAQLEFGGLAQVQEEYRDALGVRAVDAVWRDLRFAVRSLRATPVVTAVAILSLALAIGANTAVFSVMNSVMLRTLPVADPSHLVLVTDGVGGHVRAWSYPVWEQIQRRPQTFSATAAWSFARFRLTSGTDTGTQGIDGIWVSGSFLGTLGTPAMLGRALSEADDRRGGGAAGPVAVISYAFWQRHFAGAPDVMGRALRLDAVPFTIVGVTAPEFFGPEVGRTFDVLLPLGAEPLVHGRDSFLDSVGTNFLTVIARLRPGQSVDAATAELRGEQSQIREEAVGHVVDPGAKQDVDRYVMKEPFTLVSAATGASSLRRDYARALVVITWVVALVLLVACVNIANLLLARATARRHELGVRLALGASRRQLARQLFSESLVLAGIGAACGLFMAIWSSRALVQQLSTPENAVFLALPMDLRVLTFTVSLTILTTLLFGTAPAFRATRVVPIDAVKAQGRSIAEHAHGMSGSLVVGQVALSLVVLVAAGLLIRSFTLLTSRQLGFQPDRVLVVTMDTPRLVDAAQRIPLFGRVRESVRALPNVAEAGLSLITPVSGAGFTPRVEISGTTVAASQDDLFGNLISPGWFRALGTRLIAGRDFTDRDRKGTARVAVVNEMFVKTVLGGSSPMGRTITLFPHMSIAQPPMEIVGVVADAVYTSLRDDIPPTWYAPLDQFEVLDFPFPSMGLSVQPRTGSPTLLRKDVEAAIKMVDPQFALTFQPLRDRVDGSLARERLLAQLAGFFGVFALMLVGIGLYGVTAYAVSRRRREIGIRMALGAEPSWVIRLVLARVSLLIGAGVFAGGAASLWASKFVGSLIWGLAARDVTTLVGAAAVLFAIGTLAAWLPARRAVRIDPVATLRES